jgi:hypothetical protein
MRSRKTGELQWTVTTLAPLPSATLQDSWALGTDLLKTIADTLRNKTRDVALSFGAFGEFQASGMALSDPCGNVLLLPRLLRQRIEWLCVATMTYRTRHGTVRAIDDASLLERFQNLRVPERLAAHKRAIDHEIASVSSSPGRLWPSH